MTRPGVTPTALILILFFFSGAGCVSAHGSGPFDADAAWRCLLALRDAVRAAPAAETYPIAVSTDNTVTPASGADAACVTFAPSGVWRSSVQVTAAVAQLFDLYAAPAMASSWARVP